MMRDIFAFSYMQTVVKDNGVRNVKCSAFDTYKNTKDMGSKDYHMI